MSLALVREGWTYPSGLPKKGKLEKPYIGYAIPTFEHLCRAKVNIKSQTSNFRVPARHEKLETSQVVFFDYCE